jgi:hypothetical protein
MGNPVPGGQMIACGAIAHFEFEGAWVCAKHYDMIVATFEALKQEEELNIEDLC